MRTVKTAVISIIAVIAVSFCFTGCSTIFGPKVVQYSYADGYSGASGTAMVTFKGDRKYGVNFRALDGQTLPPPEEKTIWSPDIIFPAGVPLNSTVHVSYDGRDHFSWTGWVFSGIGNVNGEGALGLLFLLGFTLARDILWSPVIIGDIITAKSQATERDVTFLCPALENGRKYKVNFKRKGKKYFVYVRDTGSGKTIYEHEFERLAE
jgi:hypothetical protein